MERKVTLVTEFGKSEVNSEDLAKNLRTAAKIAKDLGLRPGQPILDYREEYYISLEKTFTLATIFTQR